MIKRSTILKYLKYHGKYERRHFTMKKADLEDECKKLGIDLTQNIEDGAKEAVKQKVKPVAKPKVVIQEPSSSDDESSDDEVEQTPTPVPSPVPAVVKKLTRKNQRVEKAEQKVEKTSTNNIQTVNDLLKDLNYVIKQLFSEFDRKHLDDVDEEYIKTEFDMTISECQDMLDKLIIDFSDAEINKIEKKIDMQYVKLERFLS
jgi:hypothetical protein